MCDHCDPFQILAPTNVVLMSHSAHNYSSLARTQLKLIQIEIWTHRCSQNALCPSPKWPACTHSYETTHCQWSGAALSVEDTIGSPVANGFLSFYYIFSSMALAHFLEQFSISLKCITSSVGHQNSSPCLQKVLFHPKHSSFKILFGCQWICQHKCIVKLLWHSLSLNKNVKRFSLLWS